MRLLLISMLLLATSLFACPGGCQKGQMIQNGCHKKMVSPRSTLGTVKYALHIMQLQENPDISLAIHAYKQSVRSLKRGMNTDAFKGGAFNKELYIQNSRKQQKLQAEIDLFETIYLILDDEQKAEFHRLMAAHQHYMSLDNVAGCGCGSSCSCPTCDYHNKPRCDKPLSGEKRGCDAPMKPKGCR